MKATEKQIENAIFDWLNLQVDLFAFKVQTMGVYDARLGLFRRTNKNVVKGTADILICLPIGELGILVALEVKSEKGRQSDNQKDFESRLKASKGHYYVVRSIKDVEFALEDARKTALQAIKAKKASEEL